MMASQNHPLPAPPVQQERPGGGRPRAKSSFSFHSRKSSGSVKMDLHETHEEKQKKRLTTKADPSMAMTEAEPAAVAAMRASIAPIRSLVHRDGQGNPIADPDKSNPTRNRWERPLDTIRSFEAAIEGSYSRKSYIRTEPDGPGNINRRSSYYGGSYANEERPRFPQSGYYGGRSQSYRPESYIENRPNGAGNRDSYHQSESGPSNGYYPNRARYPRTASEPHINSGHGIYPMPGHQQSHETVGTNSGSGSSGSPAGYQTDPSSANSSLDRVAPLPPTKEYGENYSISNGNGYSQYSQDQYGHNQRQSSFQNQAQGPPAVPRKEMAIPRVPIQLGSTSGNAGPARPPLPSSPEKRKSWFGKRFSRS